MSRRTLHVARGRPALVPAAAGDSQLTLRDGRWRDAGGHELPPARVVELIFEHDVVVVW